MASPLNLVPDILQIDVQDWSRMIAFYQETFGFAPLFLDAEHRYGWLQAGPITLALRGVEHFPEVENLRTALLFRVEHIDSMIGELEQRGCAFYDKQLQTGETYQIAYFRDPEGNSLAIYTDTDIS